MYWCISLVWRQAIIYEGHEIFSTFPFYFCPVDLEAKLKHSWKKLFPSGILTSLIFLSYPFYLIDRRKSLTEQEAFLSKGAQKHFSNAEQKVQKLKRLLWELLAATRVYVWCRRFLHYLFVAVLFCVHQIWMICYIA